MWWHRYKSDIALMQQLGLKHLRLSLSWSRLLPQGRAGSPVNPEAVKFYSSVLDALAAAGKCSSAMLGGLNRGWGSLCDGLRLMLVLITPHVA